MTYELAKQLKDSGFPQSIDRSSGIDKLLGGVPYSPRLSELVEACGDEFDYLREPYGNPENNDFDVFWRAFSKRDDLQSRLYMKIQGEGSTPEEAVAKLWLALSHE
jgi:hypothetical protein